MTQTFNGLDIVESDFDVTKYGHIKPKSAPLHNAHCYVGIFSKYVISLSCYVRLK